MRLQDDPPGRVPAEVARTVGLAHSRDEPGTANYYKEDGHSVGPDLLTDAQLAERWQLSRGTLANQRSQGRGPAYLKIAGRVRYRRSDIEAYEKAGRVVTQQAPAGVGTMARESIALLIRSAGV